MAKQHPVDETGVETGMDAPITKAELLALIANLSQSNVESQKSMAEIIAGAMIEARKPYVDPKQEENDRMFREQNRRQMEQERKAKYAAQKVCPHIAGCNSLSEVRDFANRTCIVWHQSDSTEVVGICTNCQRIFHETDADYQEWRQKPSFNRMSKSGYREFTDPMEARKRARS